MSLFCPRGPLFNVPHMAVLKVHMCGTANRKKQTGYKSKIAIVRLRFMFHYCKTQ